MKKLLPDFYPGWWVHAGLFACALVVLGSSSYTFGLFVVPLTEEFDVGRADLNNGFIALLLGVALFSPVVGRLLDRFSARLVILSGGVMYALGLAGLANAESLWLMLLLILLPVSYGYAACGTLAVNTVVVRWFKRRRGTALGIIAVSTSAGGFIFAPFTATVMENFDWRTALLVNGGIVFFVVCLMVLLLVRNWPRGTESGYNREFDLAEADEADSATQTDEKERTWSSSQLLRNRNFWLVVIAVSLLFGSDQAMITSMVPYFVETGMDAQAAAFILSIMTASSVCGKLLVGYLADKVDLRYVFYVVAAAHIALLTVYLFQPGYWLILGCVAVFGVGIGGVYPAWSTLVAWLFGTRSFGLVMGSMTLIVKGFSIVLVRFIGEVYDATGGYEPAFITFIAGVVVSIILASMLRPQPTMESDSAASATVVPKS